MAHMGVSQKLGVPFWGPHNKEHSILEFIFGSLVLGNYHIPTISPTCTL